MNVRTILILESVAPIAWAVNAALIAGLNDVKNHIKIIVCTSCPSNNNQTPTMLDIVNFIHEANLVLLSRDLWHYSVSDFTPYLAEKQITCISSQRINGYCMFPDKHNLLKDPSDQRYINTASELCTLIKRALNLQRNDLKY